jgi:outer membrane protein assembly factor BamB
VPLLALIVAVAATVAGFTQAGVHDYPQWRGPHRDGSAAGFEAPASWPKALTRLWKADVGEGYATPLVVGDRVYAFTRIGGQERRCARGSDRRGTLAIRLSRTVSPGPPAAAHGAGPKATPLYYEGKLFTLGISGIVTAFDAAAGKILWQTAPPAEAPFSVRRSIAARRVRPRDRASGQLRTVDGIRLSHRGRQVDGGGDGFFASPIAVTLGGVRQIVSATIDSVIGVALDGRVLWRHPWEGGGGSTTPVVNGDTIIVSALDKGMTALRPIVRGGVWTVETVWKTSDVSMYVSNPVVVADTVFGLSTKARGQFFAVDATSGRVLWLGSPREAENTAVVKSGDLLFLLNDDAELIVARASRRGFEPVARYTVADGATWAQPAMSGHRIFVKDARALTLWTVD